MSSFATADTERLERPGSRDARRLVLPITSIVSAVGAVAVAVALWQGDRSELKSTTKATEANRIDIDRLKLEAAARDARSDDIRRQLDRMQLQLDRIADRVGAAKQ